MVPFICTTCGERFEISPQRFEQARKTGGSILCPVDQMPLTRLEAGYDA